MFIKAYKNWLSSNERKRNVIDEVNNDLEMPITTESTTTGREDYQTLDDLEINESLPGLEHLSGKQLFFLNFAQVP